MDCIEDMALVL